jgi:cell division protein FtsB
MAAMSLRGPRQPMHTLQQEIAALTQDNAILMQKIKELQQECDDLRKENATLANDVLPDPRSSRHQLNSRCDRGVVQSNFKKAYSMQFP